MRRRTGECKRTFTLYQSEAIFDHWFTIQKMNSKETLSHPTGSFPSVEEEFQLRFDFLDKNNPVLKKIRVRLEILHFHRKRNLPLNLLAFYYGVYFYNQISHQSLFPEKGKPPIKLVRHPRDPYSIYVLNAQINYNLGSAQAETDLDVHPEKEVDIEDPFITLPSYVSQILDGLEEASHLHLELLHQEHRSNHNQRSDYRSQEKLWIDSSYDSIAYQAKLWHEFAALVVKKSYLNYYWPADYPSAVPNLTSTTTRSSPNAKNGFVGRKRFRTAGVAPSSRVPAPPPQSAPSRILPPGTPALNCSSVR